MAARDQLERDQTAIAGILNGVVHKDFHTTPITPENVDELMERASAYLSGPAYEAWMEKARPIIEDQATRAARRVTSQLGIRFDLLTPGVQAYTQREAAFLVTSVTDTTRQYIRDALTGGLEAGEGISGIAKRIMQRGTFSNDRATLIARTETTRVQNGAQMGTLSEYKAQTGDAVTKEWVSAQDDRVRAEHLALNGEKREVDQAFSNGLLAPGEPNCRCTLIYSVGGP